MEPNKIYKPFLSKGNHKQNKNTIYELGKIFSNDPTDKGLISKIYKKVIWFKNKNKKKI